MPPDNHSRDNTEQKATLFWLLIIGAGLLWWYFNSRPPEPVTTAPVTAQQNGQRGLAMVTPLPTNDFLLAPQAYRATVIQNSNMRVGPGKNYAKVAILTSGTPVMVTGYNDQSGWPWYCIQLDGATHMGWISSELVSGVPEVLPFVPICGEVALSAPATSDEQYDEQYDEAYEQYLEGEAAAALEESMAAMSDAQTDLESMGYELSCDGGCTTYPTWCVGEPIKGNISQATGERIYHVVGQEYYDITNIDSGYGERWFCTEDEAQRAGWRKAFK